MFILNKQKINNESQKIDNESRKLDNESRKLDNESRKLDKELQNKRHEHQAMRAYEVQIANLHAYQQELKEIDVGRLLST
jgi:hypothetical protein